jgi:Uma2 family endonuclease
MEVERNTGMLVPQDHWVSLEEYHKIEEENPDCKFEYANGKVYAMAGGSLEHSQIAVNLITALRVRLRGTGCRVFNSDAHVLPTGTGNPSYLPDVTVTCNPEDYKDGKSTEIRFPRLIIEVLSPTTYSKDRIEKLYAYQACASVQEYVMISTHHQQVEIYRRGSEETWTQTRYRHGQMVTFASVELTIPVSDIYEDTTVPTLAPVIDVDYW